MKRSFLILILAVTVCLRSTAQDQKPVYPKPDKNNAIAFGQKLPPPSALAFDAKGRMQQQKNWGGTPYVAYDSATKTYKAHFPGRLSEEAPQILPGKGKATGGGQGNNETAFHLTKDLNPRAESDPSNFRTDIYPSQFAVLNGVAYFYADDGIHGRELWRSNATPSGTYMVKDIAPGERSSGDFTNQIAAINGKIYFVASDGNSGKEPWVSDGTEKGTLQLADIGLGSDGSYPSQFVGMGNTVFFVASSNNYEAYKNQLWKTDGSQIGTALITDLANWGGTGISEATAAAGQLFFTFSTYWSGRQLWRSDGTEVGTFQVKQIGWYNSDDQAPMQLTAYGSKLFFSANDGSGRRLWTSDGTEAGTNYAPGFNDVYLRTDYIGSYSNFPFAVLNNVLYVPGDAFSGDGNGLYKYDASTNEGLVLVKDLTPAYDNVFITPGDMAVVDNQLYFKVISAVGGYHDELWKSDGKTINTTAYKVFAPGNVTYAFVAGYSAIYFAAYAPGFGREVWKSNGTDAGTFMVKDIWPGPTSSAPYYFTPVNGKILMNAADSKKGASLYASDGTEEGTVLLKDINTNSTGSSYAGALYKSVAPLNNGVVFTAFEREHGYELYASDGTTAGTNLLNDIDEGEDNSYPNNMVATNEAVYFIAYNNGIGAVYKTDGTTAGLKKVVDLGNNPTIAFTATDNGLVFYVQFDSNTYAYQLWRSDGTPQGTYLLGANLYYYPVLTAAGNVVYYVAGDYGTGYELWKSDGTIAGTGMVKDISPGYAGSYPFSLFAYNGRIYFGASDGVSYVNSFWRSDGTAAGTIKLKDITPPMFYDAGAAHIFYTGSKGNVYFSAVDYNNYTTGSELYITDGTPRGTRLVKDINATPYGNSYPAYPTDVNGIVYFMADDGVYGRELWSSDGTTKGTQLVKDITPGWESSYLYDFCAIAGKLFFVYNRYPNGSQLWVSDRVHANDPNKDDTRPVDDPVLNSLNYVGNPVASGNKLFLIGYNYKYGQELYVGDVTSKPFFVVNRTATNNDEALEEKNTAFDIAVSPNPSRGAAMLYIKSNGQPTQIRMTDMSGKTVWQQTVSYHSQKALPTERLPAGVYLITVQKGVENKTLRFLKE